MNRHTLCATLLGVSLTTACGKADPAPAPAPAPASVAAPSAQAPAPTPPAGAAKAPQRAKGAPDEEPNEEVQPVYPRDVEPHPLAVRLCDALHTLPAKRRAECCSLKNPGFLVTPECVRNLSGALALEGVTLSEASVQACEAAMAAAHQGCGWVGPTKVPVPPECRGLLEGTAKAGAPCRSSLECPSGLFCRGGGPTQAGVCSPPGEPGRPCHQSVDALAVHTRQHHDAERNHPECQGYCSRKRCVPVTETCKANVQCGRDKHCVEGRCVDGPYAKAGAPCADTGCEPGSHCVDHVCTPLRPEGEACTRDDQCLGACLKPEGATEGTCGMRCFASFTP